MKLKFNRTILILLALAMPALACNVGKQAATATVTPPPPATALPPTALPPTPTATSQVPDVLGDEARNEAGGFSYRQILGYTTEDEPGMVEMLAEGADPDLGPVVNLFGGQAEEGVTAESLLADLSGSTDLVVGENSPVTISDKSGLQVDVSLKTADAVMRGRVVVIVANGQQFAALAGAPESRWESELEPLFRALLDSVTIFPLSPSIVPSAQPLAPSGSSASETLTRQWAWAAAASSEYESSDWSANQAVGAPNTLECSDSRTAWASLESNTQDYIQLWYTVPVIPTQINIYQTYNPSSVTRVSVRDMSGSEYEVYQAAPAKTVCPYVLTIDIDNVPSAVAEVIINLDQSVIGDWNEIDAVELVGMPEEGASVPPTTPGGQAGAGDGKVLWRKGGQSSTATGSFASLGGMDLADDRLLYVADSTHGVFLFDSEVGNLIETLFVAGMKDTSDVKIYDDWQMPYTANPGSSQVLSAMTESLAMGSSGSGEGQFGEYAPWSLAVSPLGEVYAIDQNQDANGQTIMRIQVFDSTGVFQRNIPIEDDSCAPEGMDFGPDGNLYVVCSGGGYMLAIAQNGFVLGKKGEHTLASMMPRGLAIDRDGNFYLTTLAPPAVVKLDKKGSLVWQWGTPAMDIASGWKEGWLYEPYGIAVRWDGSVVYVSDSSEAYSYITAFAP